MSAPSSWFARQSAYTSSTCRFPPVSHERCISIVVVFRAAVLFWNLNSYAVIVYFYCLRPQLWRPRRMCLRRRLTVVHFGISASEKLLVKKGKETCELESSRWQQTTRPSRRKKEHSRRCQMASASKRKSINGQCWRNCWREHCIFVGFLFP